jgi:hypothetical protein
VVTGDEDSPGFDTSVAHPARVYDYWLGGKDHFEADRIAEEVIAVRPTIIRANRAFLGRAVRFLAGTAGIRQFLDVGTGIPSANNTHEVAQSVAPESRIVYVDNDPIVLAHARSLLTSSPEGACAFLDADLKDTAKILAAMTGATVPGSYLALTQPAKDMDADIVAAGARRYNQRVTVPQTRRTYAETLRFFAGLHVVPPGLVQCHRWRPDPGAAGLEENVSAYGGVARKD